ncbi:hypothetical protein FNYG_08096 [Fusarium nygamai]|uniref:Carrier domain-containing protein n=1 Tax=Gibberella nygamai TaxID=42673 RepID=A0A2K0W8D8_GIBNY|nr:hypothetical protein FNYG_08096 [Fusarium nygamai]
MPINSSGKLEFRRVAQWIDKVTDDMYEHIPRNLPDTGPEAGPGSPHSIISEAVAEVINLPGQVSLRGSFVSMGSDSITAMRVMALCRPRGVSLPDEDEPAPFPLSPIQKLHLAQFPDGESHYNQSILLKLRRPASQTVLHAALLELVRRQRMLRARFDKGSTGGKWSQRVTTMSMEA